MSSTVDDFRLRGKTETIFVDSLETKRRVTPYSMAKALLIRRVPDRRPSMSLIEKIPTLSDEEVVNLLDNARRLQETGDERQQAAAAELLPALEEAAAERKAARLASAQAKRAAARPKKVAA
jgi:hypothetical protein